MRVCVCVCVCVYSLGRSIDFSGIQDYRTVMAYGFRDIAITVARLQEAIDLFICCAGVSSAGRYYRES